MKEKWERQLRLAKTEIEELKFRLEYRNHEWWEREMMKDDMALAWQLKEEAEGMLRGYDQ